MATNRIAALAVNDALETRATFTPAAVAAFREFVRSKPWRGDMEQRREKFETLNAALAAAYEIPVPEIRFANLDSDSMSNGAYSGEHNLIVMVGRLSVVTYFFCFAMARGMKRKTALKWAQGCFKRFFPLSFSRCRIEGDLILKAE